MRYVNPLEFTDFLHWFAINSPVFLEVTVIDRHNVFKLVKHKLLLFLSNHSIKLSPIRESFPHCGMMDVWTLRWPCRSTNLDHVSETFLWGMFYINKCLVWTASLKCLSAIYQSSSKPHFQVISLLRLEACTQMTSIHFHLSNWSTNCVW